MHFYGKNIFEKTTCFSKSRMNTTHPDQSIHPLTSFKHGSQTLNLHLPRWLFVGSAIDLQPTPWQKTYFLKGICVFFLLYIKQTWLIYYYRTICFLFRSFSSRNSTTHGQPIQHQPIQAAPTRTEVRISFVSNCGITSSDKQNRNVGLELELKEFNASNWGCSRFDDYTLKN